MLLSFIGIIVGIVMGLTGAGGALIAIPLFMHFLDMPLKEASVYSLVTVVIASFFNFINQRKNADYKLSLFFIAVSFLGSYLSGPYKKLLPEMGVVIILILVSFYALYSVWTPLQKTKEGTMARSWVLTCLIGFFLGVLTTFSGLGGGVLMLPILLNFYGFSQDKAVATSLMVVGASSLISFLLQVEIGAKSYFGFDFFYLLFALGLSSFLVKILISRVSPAKILRGRQILFSLVVIVALGKIGISLF